MRPGWRASEKTPSPFLPFPESLCLTVQASAFFTACGFVTVFLCSRPSCVCASYRNILVASRAFVNNLLVPHPGVMFPASANRRYALALSSTQECWSTRGKKYLTRHRYQLGKCLLLLTGCCLRFRSVPSPFLPLVSLPYRTFCVRREKGLSGPGFEIEIC